DDEDMLPTTKLVSGVIADWSSFIPGTDTYVLPSERQCMAWNVGGDVYSVYPVSISGASQGNPVSPAALGNLDSGAEAEVLFSTVVAGANSVLAYRYNGLPLPSTEGWPFRFPDGVGAYGGFSVADLDRDGNVEVVFGTNDGLLHCWEFGSCTIGYAPWPMYQHDCGRSGALE
ncbi:MAG TPA: hypothetical protein PK991_05120, partial [Candidatus Sabulitectum sp.]|nr:hypothetical protein [Candidatus Sabulitectum sp.]